MVENIILPSSVAGVPEESTASSVSWPAIFAGGFVAFAMGFILLALGTGIGLSTISPYSGSGLSATTFTVYGSVWLIVVQWLSSALGGYVTGRLRTKWVNLHTEEVSFRDTAHGLLAWAVAVAMGVGLLGLIAAATKPATSSETDHALYYADELFRSPQPLQGDIREAKAEATRIFVMAAANRKMPDEEKNYLSQLVAARTGLSKADASTRVTDVVAKGQSDIEAARKAATKTSLYIFFSMLLGAFIACVAGAVGGRKRDLY